MTQAIILAGGKGERLRPLTEDRPKCMIELLGNPLMSYQLHWLRSYGITKVTICCGYLHDLIREHFGNGAKWQMELDYLVEQEPLGRGGALKAALAKSGADEPVLAINGDHICNLALDDLANDHLKHRPLATLVTVPLRSTYGIVDVDADGLVTGFREKPELPYGVNAGIYMIDPQLHEFLPDKGDHEVATFPRLAEQGRLRSFRTNAFWRTVDTVKDVTELKNELEGIFLKGFFRVPV